MIEKGICMADGKTGAIILAAGRSAHMEELKPMLRMGQTTMIQKEIDTIRQAGISPIVVVTGYQADVLERHISHRGAVCIRNKRYETSQMYGSICMGLRHIQKKADRVLLFPADVPMITADTIEKMAQAPGSMAVPVCQGKKGHPVMLSKEVFGHILTYRGGKGLRGAMDAWGEGVREIEVEDPGVLLDTNTKMDYESLLAYEKDRQKRGELAFRASISLSREEECFSALTADFLEAVAESGSMLGACQIRDISYSKGWKMLKIAEAQLGIQFLERQTGGSKGGFSVLTPEGKVFLEKFRRMEAAVQAALEDYKKQLAKAENTPIKAENKKVRMVPIKIEKTKSERDDVFVCVNGKNFQIKRGEIVNVPEYVCEVLENMKKMDELAIERMEEATKNFA